MALLLYRLGRACAARRLLVVLVWVLVLAGAGAAAATLSGSTSSSFSIPGTESARALGTLEEEFPASGATGNTANVVFRAPDGERLTDPALSRAVTTAVEDIRAVPRVSAASNPLDPQQPTISRDARIGLATVSFAGERGELVPGSTQEAVREAVDDAREAGLRVEIGGPAFAEVPEVVGSTEVVGVVIAFAVLLLTYGSLVAAGANLLTALVGVGIGAAGITALTGFVELQSTTPILAIMLGLAVGIDYALFIFARFRGELRDGHGIDEAVGRAVGTAGSAVVFAGLTVVVALVGLSVVGIPFLTQMGLAAAGTVVVAVLVALTFVPALLRLVGVRMLGRAERASARVAGSDGAVMTGRHARERRTPLVRWGSVVAGHPALSLVAALVVLGVVAAPVTAMRTSLGDDGTADPASSARQAYDLVAEGFGPGVNGPLVLLVQGEDAQADAGRVVEEVQDLPDVAAVTPPQLAESGSTALVTVIPASGPTDEATADLVRTIRSTVADAEEGADVAVTGSTAVGIDVDAQLADALPVYLLLVVGLALLLLLVMFRSVLVPVMATVGFLLSIAAGLGATTAVYQWGWLAGVFGVAQPAPVFSLLPIIAVGILFGLAMDYQVFMVSRIHEAHAKGWSPREAVVLGFRRAAPVVVAAATIMAAVFAGFAGSDDPTVGSIALTLTVGVLADAFVVRMVIMPALLSLVGSAGWWMPRWLQRLLPHVDVEGRALEEEPAGRGRGREVARTLA